MSNKIISDYRSESLQGTIKLVDNKGNAKIFIASKPIMVSNQWIPQAKMPVKGDLITIEDKQYRVLKINKSVAEVLAMYNVESSITNFGNNNTYENSNLDKYCNNTFYNSLSSSVKSAIIPKIFTQDSWYKGTNESAIAVYYAIATGIPLSDQKYTLSLMSSTYGNSISRNCYALSIKDIIDYVDATTEMTFENTTLTPENIKDIFSTQNGVRWLSSANSIKTSESFMLTPPKGYIDSNSTGLNSTYYAAFQIDLSKIEFVKN